MTTARECGEFAKRTSHHLRERQRVIIQRKIEKKKGRMVWK